MWVVTRKMIFSPTHEQRLALVYVWFDHMNDFCHKHDALNLMIIAANLTENGQILQYRCT